MESRRYKAGGVSCFKVNCLSNTPAHSITQMLIFNLADQSSPHYYTDVSTVKFKKNTCVDLLFLLA